MNSRNGQHFPVSFAPWHSLLRLACGLFLLWLSAPYAKAQLGDPCSGLTAPLLLGPDGGVVPDIVIDHLGRAHVVWRGNDAYVYYAQVGPDGTITIPARRVYDYASTLIPRLAVDASGDVHIITTTFSPGSSLVYLKVSNGNRVLINVFTMFTPGVWDTEEDYSPSIAISPLTGLPVVAAEVQLSYHYDIGGFPVYRYNQEVSVVSLDAAGVPVRSSRWSAYYLRNNSAPVFRAQYAEVAVDDEGTSHCVWLHTDPDWTGAGAGYARGGAGYWVDIANTHNLGGTAGRPRIVRGDPGLLEIIWSTSAGTVVWQQMDEWGFTVTDDTVISQPGDQPSRPHIAVGKGGAFASWADAKEAGGMQIYSRSLLSGATESKVSCSPVSVFNHALASRGNSRFDLVWQDNRSGVNQVFYRAIATPLAITMHQAEEAAVVNAEPGVGIDAPLVLTTDPVALSAAAHTPLSGGLVADGVTPLLIKLTEQTPTTGTNRYRITLAEPSGGTAVGGLGPHLRVLEGRVYLQVDTHGVVTSTVPAHASSAGNFFAFISAIRAEDLTLEAGQQELTCSLAVQPIDTFGNAEGGISTLRFKLRKPPIALVHGIADDENSWSGAFKERLASDRPYEFIIPIRYGVGGFPMKQLWPNALAPLDQLVREVNDALQTQFELPLRANWAFTRYDAIGHSQGGVLLRMLCQNTPNPSIGRFIQRAVVSSDNSFRGRFRRVITIGSPHNGTTIAWYIWKLHESADPADRDVLSVIYNLWFAGLAVAAPRKFDPFDPQIAEINNPNFPADARIKFNCIRTRVNGGLPPDVNPIHDLRTYPAAYTALGLWFPTAFSGESRGQVIIPDGSDGVVDYLSQGGGWLTPLTPVGMDIAHADMGLLFGVPAGQSQTTSAEVADTAASLLEGPENRFGPFRLPSLLTNGDRQRFEASLVLGQITGTVIKNLIRLLPGPKDLSTNVLVTLDIPPELPVAGPVSWHYQVFGPGGLSITGVVLTVDTNDTRNATVSVADGVQGNVCVCANYITTNGVAVFAAPTSVFEAAVNSSLVRLSLLPAQAVLSPGNNLPTSIWGVYANGTSSLLYLSPEQISYRSSNTNVSTISSNGIVNMKSFGRTTITVVHGGLSATLEVVSPQAQIGELWVKHLPAGTLQFSWTSTPGTQNILEASTNLVHWMPLATLTNTLGYLQYEDFSWTNSRSKFYRIGLPGD